MDIVTQGLLGATLAQSAADKDETRIAVVIGFVAGLLADADALIRSPSDSLLTIEYHRHFTHSVFFIPIGALLAALLLLPLLRRRISFARLYLFSLLGYSLSGFLDLCTSYGTYFFWPLLDERLAFNIISILDPVFSAILLLAIVLCLVKRRAFFARAGLALAAGYLFCGYVQMERARAVAEGLANERGHPYARMLVKPTIFNLLLWRAVYESDGYFYVDAIRVGLSDKIYPGKAIRKFELERDLPTLNKASVLYRDIQRFDKFSDSYLAWSPEQASTLGDMRYAMLPNGLRPLWGIRVDAARPDEHARYQTFRGITKEDRQGFWKMLSGK